MRLFNKIKNLFKKDVSGPELYSEESMISVEKHIETHFGHIENVFHELVSTDIHVDIMIVKPSAEKNFYTLVTMGMGAHEMNAPENGLSRAELLICLPPEWKINDDSEEWYWPIRFLKILARLPVNSNTWLGYGHTVSGGGPLAPNTQLTDIGLDRPKSFGEKSFKCGLPYGGAVNFYQMIPLYGEERDYKIKTSMEDLEKLFGGAFAQIVDINRRNLCE